MFLIVSLISNIGILAVFKYYNFFIENINALIPSSAAIPYIDILLPIGLSFHTFQAMSYTIEVYRGNFKAEKHFGIYALYVMFYPQLVAGPIERPQNVLPQLHEEKKFDRAEVVEGLKMMLWGLFKKIVIADRLAKFTDVAFNAPQEQTPAFLVIATFFFAFQIYCDFSGYSDIALGTARVMGFKLMRNFDRPYTARSISEFWKRWHISLSTWFRDHLYIPLGGNRVAIPRLYFNIFFVFLVSGFWHGANWTFILWGAIHGTYLITELITAVPRKKILSKLPDPLVAILSNVVCFIMVSFAWIFFRADSIEDGAYIASQIPQGISDLVNSSAGMLPNVTGFMIVELLLGLSLIMALMLAEKMQEQRDLTERFNSLPVAGRWTIYYIAVIMLIFFGVYEDRQFIYFQF